MANRIVERRFADMAALQSAAVEAIRSAILAGVAARGTASLALSGGTTPIPIYEALSHLDLPWSQVQLTLTDERWVPVDDPASNEAMVRRILLKGPAALARFTSLKCNTQTPEAAEGQIDGALRALAQPFDLVLLGMGDDAHTASLFPGGAGLEAAMDLTGPLKARAVRPAIDGPARLSLSLPALLQSRQMIILLRGTSKWAVYQDALGDGPVLEAPVRGILHQNQVPVTVYWTP
ncbi:MAG: 6-phosphogluconolactonase [Caulobacteraceae bacterium]|nr:6-phosphogluconolactonase [Caulobacteraceae bacterium]